MPMPTLTPDPFARGLLRRLPAPPRKVALVRAPRLGDFLCATPAIRALRAALPGAELTMITLPYLRDLVLRSPHLDRFEPFPGFPGIAEQLFESRAATDFFRRMQAERFDLAIQMHGSGVNANPFTLLLGARWTAGFVRPGDPPGLLDAALPLPPSGHEIRRLLALAAFLGAPARGEWTEFPLWRDDHVAAEALLAGCSPPYIGLHPGARDRSRRWPPECFAAVGDTLIGERGGTAVLLGDAEERPIAEAVAARLTVPHRCLAGRTSLPALGAVIARLAVLVTNDTGPAHIAYALGVPSVTVVGGVDPSVYAPPCGGRHVALVHPVRCRPAGGVSCTSCPHGYACLDGISVEAAVEAARRLLRAPNKTVNARLLASR